jgi:glycosyltransferase involved in cell wall biosynthesis
MRRLIDDVVSKGEVEVLHVDQLTMTQFALSPRFESNGRPARRLPFRLFDAHNATWTIVARMGHNVLWPFSPVLALEAKRIKRYEGGVVRQFDHTLAVSDIDHQALLHAARASKTAGQMRPDHISVIPIAIDTVQLQPVHRLEDAPRILTLGTLHYPPNANGIRWFIRQVFPLIRQAVPNATLTVVGKNPPSDFVRWAEQLPEAIRVTGYVPDLTPLLERASVMVVPVLAGGGMRVRILEAFARGVPVVTTTVGLEGIDAKPDEDVLVADTPEQFASAVTRILHEQRLQDRLASNGRRLVVSRYDWQVVLEQLDVVYQTAFRGPSEAVG